MWRDPSIERLKRCNPVPLVIIVARSITAVTKSSLHRCGPLTALTLVLLSGCTGMAPAIAARQSDLATRCLGRYLIQVPSQAATDKGDAVYKDTEILVTRGRSEAQLEADIDRKVRNYRRSAAKRGGEAFVARESLGPHATLIRHSASSQAPKNVDYEAFLYRPQQSLVYKFDAKRPFGQRTANVAQLQGLIESIASRATGEIPDQPGFCLTGGFIPDDGATAGFERASAAYKWGSGDKWINFTVHATSSKVREDVLDNPTVKLMQEQAKRFGVSVIRFQKKDLDWIKGGEYAIHYPHKDPAYYEMNWQSRPVGVSPNVTLTLGAGDAFSRADVLALWDRLLAGFRPCTSCTKPAR